MTSLTRLLLLLVLVLAGCADPDVASTDGSAAQPTDVGSEADVEIDPVPGTGTVDTTTGPADGDVEPVPMPVEPDGGIGDGAGPPATGEPPAFGVSSETDSMSVEPVSWCWTDTDGVGVCADGIAPSPLPEITADSQLVITFDPGELRVGVDDNQLPVVQENPGVYLVDTSGLEPGSYEVGLGYNGDAGDASAFLTLTIERG